MNKEKRLVPKRRFKEFENAGDWEQRKLAEYLEPSFDTNASNQCGAEDVLSVSGDYGVVNQIELLGRSFAGASLLKYKVVRIGDVVYTKSPLKFNPFGIIKANKLNHGIVSTLYGVYSTKGRSESSFIQAYFDQDSRLNSYLYPLVNKGAKNTLLITDLQALNGLVVFPKNVEEPKEVSRFLCGIDKVITLHQREDRIRFGVNSALKVSALQYLHPDFRVLE